MPTLAEARDAVQRDWASDKRKTLADHRFNELLKHYDVAIEPEPKALGAGVGQPMIRLAFILACLLQAIVALPATAHELRPAYLDIRETAADDFAVVWKVPARGDLRLGLYVRLPDACKPKSEPVGSIEAGAFFERWSMICAGGLKGREIAIDGLRSTLTDALARIEYRDGTTQSRAPDTRAPQFIVSGVQSTFEVARTYFLLGVEHILSGIDHLLFVLALILLIRDRWMLVKTITAFTVAHSITLAGAALGYFSLPQPPVEATIALSIAFVARELARAQPGERRLSESYPWVLLSPLGCCTDSASRGR